MNCVDLFAGLGGFSEGAEQAGCAVICAANHWSAAVDAHKRNHPKTRHLLQDLSQADFTLFPKHDLLLASPACQGHSRARGVDRPHHDACRSTAWAVISCAEVHSPFGIVVENVVEFLRWKLYPAWKKALETLGYKISENVLNAADFGVAQNRVRLVIVAIKGTQALPIRWPGIWHDPASSIIDPIADNWSPVRRKGRSLRTLEQIKAARRKHGPRFIIAYYGAERAGRSLDAPLGTVTTRERFALVHGDRMRMLTVNEYKAAMGFRPDYWLPDCRKTAVHLLGNAVPPPMAKGVIQYIKRSA